MVMWVKEIEWSCVEEGGWPWVEEGGWPWVEEGGWSCWLRMEDGHVGCRGRMVMG